MFNDEIKNEKEILSARLSKSNTSMSTTSTNMDKMMKLIENTKYKKGSAKGDKYTLASFMNTANELTTKSSISLDYFFVYVKYILNHTREKFFEKLRFYQRLCSQTESL